MLHNILVVFIFFFQSAAFAGAYEDALAAAAGDNIDALTELVGRGLDPNTTDAEGHTLLAIAARGGNLRAVELLLAHRASVNKRSRFGDTPLHLAALAGHVDVVERLLRAGALTESSGWTALHYAVFGGHGQIVSRLLTRDPALLDQRAPNGQTALMLAAKAGNFELLRQLLAAGADRGLRDFDGKDARQIALEGGSTEIDDILGSAR